LNKKNNIYFIFIILSIICQSVSVAIGKKAALSMSGYTFYNVITNPYYIISLFILGLQAIFWQLALKQYNLSFAYLFTSLIYPIILIISYFIYNENISMNNIIGSLIIVVGVIIVTRNTNGNLIDSSGDSNV